MRKRFILFPSMALTVLLTSGVALAAGFTCSSDPCIGTGEADEIHGTASAETIQVLGGEDAVFSFEGNDVVYGGYGVDYLKGNEGNDTIYGGLSNDTIYGGLSNDTIYGGLSNDSYLAGGEGSDTVYGGKGADNIDAVDGYVYNETEAPIDHTYGEGGNDTIRANDGKKDFVNCGGGRTDSVYYDVEIDEIMNCEIKNPTM